MSTVTFAGSSPARNASAGDARYSIVIPTRNREEYLPFALRSVLDCDRNDIEVVVSNNHSRDGTADFLASVKDARVRTVAPPAEMPMAAHYEFALSQARGEWVTLIGDDDAVMPYIFERLDRWIERFPQVAIISSTRAYYFWSGCDDLYGNRVMEYDPGAGRAQMRSTRRDLLSALAGLRSCFDMPQIYTMCIVRNELTQRIRRRSGGRFYHSIIPDIYSAVALSLEESHYLRVDEPLFWTGTSNKSLGRGDRIYKDSGERDKRAMADATLSLHPAISQELHSLGFESLYLYEALLQSPLATASWRGRGVAALVHASLWRKSREVAASRQLDLAALRKKVLASAAERGISASQVLVGAWVIAAIQTLLKFARLPGRVLRKARRAFFGDRRLVSTQRDALPTILDASRAVARSIRWRE